MQHDAGEVRLPFETTIASANVSPDHVEQGTGADEPSPLKLLTVSGAFRLLRAYAEIEDTNLRRSIVDLVEQITSNRR